jgi:DNA-directed RNA polymerase beta' subunit
MPLSDFSYGEEVGTISKVTFGILSPERIKQKSVCEIYKHITSSKNLEGTLMDDRLGPIERGQICRTCKYTYKECVGHFGHLNLAKPVIQVQYFLTVIKLLGCYCNRCKSIMINKHDPQVMAELMSRKGKSRYAYVSEAAQKSKNRDCPTCGATQPNYSRGKEGIGQVIATYTVKQGSSGDSKNDNKIIETINPEMIHMIFKNVSDEDVALTGLDPSKSRPEWMIWTIMPIPPPAMRPSVKSETGKVSDDDLTHKLNDIIKFNNQLRIKLDEPTKQSFIDDWWQLVQYHVWTYVDNELSNVPKSTHRSGRPLKTIRQRVKAKEGRVRGNLMGKRVDGSGRSVITADPNLSMDQLGVPMEICMTLTYPEIVTPYNITQMMQCVINGPTVYPGAKSFKKKYEKSKTNLRFFKSRDKEIKLEVGDVVYRHLMENDWVLFNRQPSLHKMSMMAHRVKPLIGRTLRFNVNATSPYGADFDGDKRM